MKSYYKCKNNPFSDYGNIIVGERFIGRKREIDTICNRVLGENYGNIAIMGLPRIGKSSLAWNALLKHKDKLATEHIMVLRVNIGEIDNSQHFFECLILNAIDELEEMLDDEIRKRLATIIDNLAITKHSIERNNLIYRFFRLVKNTGIRLIYILDEFDNISKFFKLSDFQFLRELAINPDYKVCLVTISRRTIQELEPENGAISNFYGVFTDLRLGMFSNEDIDEYWKKFKDFDIKISDSYAQKVNYLVGHHPFLMDLVNFNVYNTISEDIVIIDENFINEIESELRLTLFTNFDSTLSLIKKENLYSKAFQLVLGPIFDVSTIDEQKLIKYQFIKKISKEQKEKLLCRNIGLVTSDNYAYICFSEYFTEYLNLKFTETDFWPIWKELEKEMREVIKYCIKANIGEIWEDLYLKMHADKIWLNEAVKRLQTTRESSTRKFGTLASHHLIDYTFPRDMYDHFISPNWEWFKVIFNTDNRREWGKKFNLLSDVRNPIAHSNSEFISENTLSEAKSYCEQIITKIHQWRTGLEYRQVGSSSSGS